MACLCQEVAGKDIELSPTCLGQLWMFDNLTPSDIAALTRGAESNEEKMAQEIRDLA
jgi:CRP/FNR family cyclic AMP-dependent transcriptional regulator